jgi:periplasmic glucans biosynthesis protein
MNRREFVLAAGTASLATIGLASRGRGWAAPSGTPFSQATVVDVAQKLGASKFVPPPEVPSPYRDLGYDEYRDIRFRKGSAWWLGEDRGFTLEFLHAGFIYKNPVDIYIIERGTALPIPYGSHLFDFRPLDIPPIHDQPLFSGIRLLAPLNSVDTSTRSPSFRVRAISAL